jgi:hypothetical protein
MKEEKKGKALLPAGDRNCLVTRMEDKVSKAMNRMFVVTLRDIETNIEMDIFLVAEKGKRWMLKAFLSALGVTADAEGVFEYDPDFLIGKAIIARVEHYKEDWINRDGNNIKLDKAKVTEFMPSTTINPSGVTSPDQVQWVE